MNQIVRVVYEGKTYDLEVDDKIPIRLDVSAIENTRIGSFFGVGSQTFDLPGTKENNQFFKHAYKTGAQDTPAFYNSLRGYVIDNGETIIDGQFQLLEAITDEEGYVAYKCQLTDQVVQFKDELANKLIKDGDWTYYSHSLSKDNITGSWDNNLLSGSIFYPMADYGLDDPDKFPDYPRIQLGTNTGDIGSTNSPMRVNQFLPAIKVRDVLDVIFDQVNFRYTGSFVSGSDFENLYILPKAQEDLGVTGTTGAQNTFDANVSIAYSLPPVSSTNFEETEQVKAQGEISDPNNNYNTSTFEYTAPIDGDYDFSSQINFYNPCKPNVDVHVQMQFRKNGTVIGSPTLLSLSFGSYGPFALSNSISTTLNANDEIDVLITFRYLAGLGESYHLNILNFGSFFKATKAPITFEGTEVDMSLQFDASTKSIDILKGLIEQFNLVLTPSYTEPDLIAIESFQDWMRKGETKDWTEKWNTAQRISINHTVDEQPQELKLANQSDNDRFSKLAQESAPNFQYGTLRLLADNNISQGTRNIGSLFGPTVLGSQILSGSVDSEGNPTFNLNLGSNVAWPHLYKFENNKQKAFKFKPRIGYKVSNTLPTGEDIIIGTTGQYNTVSESYATIANVSELPLISGSTLDLHYNNTYGSLAPGLINNDGVSSYERYWKTYLDSLYWEESRKVILDVKFDAKEYQSIRLNDQIFIKDQYYRINNIKGINITHADVATVELIKLYPAFFQPYKANCFFEVSGSYNATSCTPPPPTPTPTVPTPTPTVPGPTPTPTPTPSAPVPTPTPSPAEKRYFGEHQIQVQPNPGAGCTMIWDGGSSEAYQALALMKWITGESNPTSGEYYDLQSPGFKVWNPSTTERADINFQSDPPSEARWVTQGGNPRVEVRNISTGGEWANGSLNVGVHGYSIE